MANINNNFKVKNGLEVAETISAESISVSSSTIFIGTASLAIEAGELKVDGTAVGGGGADQSLNTNSNVTFYELTLRAGNNGSSLRARDDVNDPSWLNVDAFTIYLGTSTNNNAGFYSISNVDVFELGTWNNSSIKIYDNDDSEFLPNKWGPAIGLSVDGYTSDAIQLQGSTTTFATNVVPAADDTYDLGTTSTRWANVYQMDLHLNNEGKVGGNSVDGTTGNWTIQEGENDLFLLNNKNGKKYRFVIQEV